MCRIKNESHKYNREQNPFLYVVWIKGIWGYKKKKKKNCGYDPESTMIHIFLVEP